MKKLLHIIATPRGSESSTLKVSGAFLEQFKATHADWTVETLDLFKETLPPLTVTRVDGKYQLLSGKDLSGECKDAWKEIVAQIERFKAGDAYLVSVPMWNFGIPYALKHYLDVIVQPRFLFAYTDKGPEGLLKGRKMVIITSRGGDYSDAPMRAYDHQVPYLQTVFGFVGITDITFIHAQGVNATGPEECARILQKAQAEARNVAKAF